MKEKLFKRVTAAAMALAMVGSSLPANVGLSRLFDGFALTAGAEEISGTYWQTAWDESTQSVTGASAAIPDGAREFTGTFDYIGNDPDDLAYETLWYVVDKDTTVDERLTVRRHKTVNLVIMDGVTLTCNKGIEVWRRDGNNDSDYYGGILNIYGESETGGKLVAKADENYAGIGGHSEYFCGKINIYSGEVEATGGVSGAGIGSGGYATVGNYGEINIYGGKVTAIGGGYGAGIGGGNQSLSQYVRIYGGEVKATGGVDAAGIGSGRRCGSFDIIINGGTVTAKGSWNGAGIGGGYNCDAVGKIIINGGTVEANSDSFKTIYSSIDFWPGAGIGSGSCEPGNGGHADFEGTITINGGSVTANGGFVESRLLSLSGAGIGSGVGTNMQGTITINGGTVITSSRYSAAIGAGNEDTSSLGYGGECEGTVNIWGGDLTLSAGDGAAAIGHGKDGSDDGTLHIDGKIAVTKGDETTPVSYLDRGKETRSNTKVHIYPCEHDASGKTYTLNNCNTHTYFCSYCGHSDTEAHNLQDGVCTGCGFNGNGSCGETAYYTLGNGKLTINGAGNMYDYDTSDNKAPWYDDRENITSIEIEDGITSIGACAFYGLSALENLTLPDSVDIIGGNAFTGTNPYFIVTTAYLDENGASKTVSGYAVTDSLSSDTRSIDWDTQDFSGYKYTFIVVDNVTVGTAAEGTTIWSEANTTLILCDGSSLTVNGYENRHAISMDNWSYTNGKDLTIYGQSKGTGKLTAVPSSNQTTTRYGIHAGSVTINGGQVTVQKGIDAYTCLNWTSPNNFVKADFYNRSVSCTKPFVLEGTTTVLDPSNSYPANYKKLVPACTFTITGGLTKGAALNSDGTVTPPAFDEGEKIDGWYTSSDYSGEKFDFDEPITNTTAFYGNYNAPHAITITNTAGGTVTADKETAKEGETVTLTAQPAEGYRFCGVSIEKKDDSSITSIMNTPDTNNRLTFTMPYSALTVTPIFEKLTGAYIAGASLSLRGEIGVNLYIKKAETLGDNAYVMVKGPNEREPFKVMLDDDSYDTKEKAYKVSCPVYAAQMGEEVTFTLYNSADEPQKLWNSARTQSYDSYMYSVNSYISAVNERTDELGTLAKDMQNYGAWARKYMIAQNKINAETAEIAEPAAISGVKKDMLAEYALTKSEDFSVTGLNMSLRLESATAIRLYYTGDKIDGIKVAFDGSKAAFTEGTANGMNYVEIPNISAQYLDDNYVVKFDNKGTVTVNALSYASLILNEYEGNESKADICSTVKALYKYNRAAQAYFESLNNFNE